MPQSSMDSATDHGQAVQASTVSSTQASEPLAKATAAIEAVISQTSAQPAARASQIAAIKATYIAEKFGAR